MFLNVKGFFVSKLYSKPFINLLFKMKKSKIITKPQKMRYMYECVMRMCQNETKRVLSE